MKRLDLLSAMLAAGAMLAPAMGWAQQPVLVGDSQISSAAATTKYGANATMNISPGNSVLMQFNLADMLPAGTTAAQVLKARLIVFTDGVTTGGTVNLYQVTSTWSEGTVTYATKPTIAGAAAASISIGANTTFHDFNATTLVQNWITTPANNFGVELQASWHNQHHHRQQGEHQHQPSSDSGNRPLRPRRPNRRYWRNRPARPSRPQGCDRCHRAERPSRTRRRANLAILRFGYQ